MKQSTTHTSTHPILAQNIEIERRGVLVIEDVTGLPSYAEPYVSPYLVVVICHQGYSRGKYDLKPIEFKAHDFSVVYPGHPIMATETSDDYRATLIIHSTSLYDEIRPHLAYGDSYLFHSQPYFHLCEEHYLCICDCAKLLKSVSSLDFAMRKKIIINLIDVMSNLGCIFRQTEDTTTTHQPGNNNTATRSLVSEFYDLLALHYKENREVRYYAKLMCLSPKYFGSLIKKEMGISAGQCIAHYVAIHAKLLLRYHPNLNIQQISHQLGFSDPPSFSRYFKSATGLTPKEFRDKYK